MAIRLHIKFIKKPREEAKLLEDIKEVFAEPIEIIKETLKPKKPKKVKVDKPKEPKKVRKSKTK